MAYLGSYSLSSNAKNVPEDVLTQNEQDNAENKKNVLSIDAWPVWNYKNNEQVRIVCYTNTTKVQLMLNGKNIGEAKPYDEETGIVYWDIPFTAGKLEVKGMDKTNKEVARYAIKTPQQPHAIKVITADKRINRKNGVAQLNLQIVDRYGVPVDYAANEIKCEIIGSATLLGLEAGNNTDMNDYTDNKHQAHKGKITAYIKASGQAQDIKITFSSKGLKPLMLMLKAN